MKKINPIGSRRKIREIMKKYDLVSNYTVKQFKIQKTTTNESKVENVVNREFNQREDLEIIISDLTYVNVHGKKWHCFGANERSRMMEVSPSLSERNINPTMVITNQENEACLEKQFRNLFKILSSNFIIALVSLERVY